jgi:hypothetical protein
MSAQPLSAPDAPAGSPSAALDALIAAHEESRSERSFELMKRCNDALSLAEEIENNARAMVGLELNNCIANQDALKTAVRQLRAQVAALNRQCTGYGRAYAALAAAVSNSGSHRAFLEEADAALDRTNAHFAFIAEKLQRE